MKFTLYPVHSFKVYSFVEPWNHHHSQYENIFITPGSRSYTIGIYSPFLPNLSLSTTSIHPSLTDLPVLGISSNESYGKIFSDCLLPLSIMRQGYPLVVSVSTSFLFIVQ